MIAIILKMIPSVLPNARIMHVSTCMLVYVNVSDLCCHTSLLSHSFLLHPAQFPRCRVAARNVETAAPAPALAKALN